MVILGAVKASGEIGSPVEQWEPPIVRLIPLYFRLSGKWKRSWVIPPRSTRKDWLEPPTTLEELVQKWSPATRGRKLTKESIHKAEDLTFVGSMENPTDETLVINNKANS